MSREEEVRLIKLAQVLDQMGPLKATDFSRLKCPLCSCPVDPAVLKQRGLFWTGIIHAHDDACPACYEGLKEYSRIVCTTCRKIVLKPKPGVDPKTGFKFIRRGCYHIQTCAVCDPDRKPSQILEKANYENKLIRGKPLPFKL